MLSVFDISAKVLSLQLEHRMSDSSIDKWCELLKDVCPKPSRLPANRRQCLVNIGVDLPAGYAPYSHHFCVNDCGDEFPFLPNHCDYVENKNDRCTTCGERRFDESTGSTGKLHLSPRKEMLVYDIGLQLKNLVENDVDFCQQIKRGNEVYVNETTKFIESGFDPNTEMWSRGGSTNSISFCDQYPAAFDDLSTIRLQLGEDGVQPFSMEISVLGTYSMGVICFQILSLPGYERSKDKWNLFAAVIPGPSEAKNFQGYMKVLTNSLKQLRTGIPAVWADGSSCILRAVLQGVTADHPAMAKLMNLVGAGAAHACWKCPCRGEKIGRGGMYFCGYEKDGKMDTFLSLEYSPTELNGQALRLERGEAVVGPVKAASTLQLELPYFCLKDNVEIEPVHTLYECCAKRFWKLVLGHFVPKIKPTPNKQFLLRVLQDHGNVQLSASSSKANLLAAVNALAITGEYVPPRDINLHEKQVPQYVCTNDQVLALRRRAEGLVVSRDRSRAPKDVTAHCLSMLASDWHHFVLEYSPCIVKHDSLHPDAFRAWSSFCAGVQLVMGLPQSATKARQAEAHFMQYLEIGESLFGRRFCCISEHNLVHLARQTITAGPAFYTSGWWLERQMKVAKRSVRNRNLANVERTMFVRYRTASALLRGGFYSLEKVTEKGRAGSEENVTVQSNVSSKDPGVLFSDGSRIALKLLRPNASISFWRAAQGDSLEEYGGPKLESMVAAIKASGDHWNRLRTTSVCSRLFDAKVGYTFDSLQLGGVVIRSTDYGRVSRRVDSGICFTRLNKEYFGDVVRFFGGYINDGDMDRYIRLAEVRVYKNIGNTYGRASLIDMVNGAAVIFIPCSNILTKALLSPEIRSDGSIDCSHTTAVALGVANRALERHYMVDVSNCFDCKLCKKSYSRAFCLQRHYQQAHTSSQSTVSTSAGGDGDGGGSESSAEEEEDTASSRGEEALEVDRTTGERAETSVGAAVVGEITGAPHGHAQEEERDIEIEGDDGTCNRLM